MTQPNILELAKQGDPQAIAGQTANIWEDSTFFRTWT